MCESNFVPFATFIHLDEQTARVQTLESRSYLYRSRGQLASFAIGITAAYAEKTP